jgi:hypothetical protein
MENYLASTFGIEAREVNTRPGALPQATIDERLRR